VNILLVSLFQTNSFLTGFQFQHEIRIAVGGKKEFGLVLNCVSANTLKGEGIRNSKNFSPLIPPTRFFPETYFLRRRYLWHKPQ